MEKAKFYFSIYGVLPELLLLKVPNNSQLTRESMKHQRYEHQLYNCHHLAFQY